MPNAEHQVLINAAVERVFDVIVDYTRYPEFLPETKTARLLSRHDGVAVVRFDVELIVRVSYTLRLVEDPPFKVTWTLAESKMIALNSGSWRLEPVGESTRATYGLEVKLAGMIPKSVSSRLMGTTLPHTLDRFKARAEALYGAPGAEKHEASKGV